MIDISLVEHIFKAACISRWNDYFRFSNLVELDKQAHKFIIAYFMAKMEKDVDMNVIIEAGIFEFLSRVIVTDIRPDVYHEILKAKKAQLNAWVITKIEPLLSSVEDPGFLERFKLYLNSEEKTKERLILKAASYFATAWEFKIIYKNSSFLSDIEDIKNKIQEELEDYYELISARKIALNQKISRLIELSARLRFQKRWAQTPRIPETSVLGHMLVVAILSYFYSLKIKACKKRLENNFYCALFHDLPESLTRDIISPVKYAITGLNELISDYELKLIDDKILPLVPLELRQEFSYILGIRVENNTRIKNEFENRIFKNAPEPFSGSLDLCNQDIFGAIDGKALKYCDTMAAFFEAGLSINYGVKSKELENGFKSMFDFFASNKSINGVNFFLVCENFKEYFKI